MPNEEIDKNLPTIGEVLKKARVKTGMSVADVAAKLHLAVKYVEGIEADDLSSLPQNLVFKRGYIRSYARLFKISDEQVQQLLHAQGLFEVPVVKKTVQIEKRQIGVRDKHVRWVTYGIIAVIVVLLVSWWRSQVSLHHEPDVKAPLSSEAVAPTEPTPAEVTPEAVQPVMTESLKKEVVKKESEKEKLEKKEPAKKESMSANNQILGNTLAPKLEAPQSTVVPMNSAMVAPSTAPVSNSAPELKPSAENKSNADNKPKIDTQKHTEVVNNLNFDAGN